MERHISRLALRAKMVPTTDTLTKISCRNQTILFQDQTNKSEEIRIKTNLYDRTETDLNL